MRQHSEFDLRVVRREQHVIGGCDKSATDLAPHLTSNRNVLQVGGRRRETSGSGGGLLISRVDSIRLPIDECQQHFGKTGLEL